MLTVGALGSLGLMFYQGRHQRSVMLMLMFTGWVLAPFVILAVAERVPSLTSASARVAAGWLGIINTLLSLGVYGRVVFGPPRPQPAFWFLILPTFLMALDAAVLGALARRSRRTPSVADA